MDIFKNYKIRLIASEDNEAMANVIRTVMPEFGASGEGFAIHDTEVDSLYEYYNDARSAYFVCEWEGEIVGGGGIAQLLGGEPNTCELRKMYFLKEGRGKRLGQHVMEACIAAATAKGYSYIYLETFNTMTSAMHLYEKNGFKKIPNALGSTGHFACDIFYLKTLAD